MFEAELWGLVKVQFMVYHTLFWSFSCCFFKFSFQPVAEIFLSPVVNIPKYKVSCANPAALIITLVPPTLTLTLKHDATTVFTHKLMLKNYICPWKTTIILGEATCSKWSKVSKTSKQKYEHFSNNEPTTVFHLPWKLIQIF